MKKHITISIVYVKERLNKTIDWNTNELDKATASLKTNKTSDPNNMINELFKEGVIGNNMKESLNNLSLSIYDLQSLQ